MANILQEVNYTELQAIREEMKLVRVELLDYREEEMRVSEIGSQIKNMEELGIIE